MKFLTFKRKNFSYFGENRFVFNTDPAPDPKGTQGVSSTVTDTEPTEPTETDPKPPNSAEARIKKLVKDRKDAEQRALEAENKITEIEQKKKEEAGEFKVLYEDTKAEIAEKDAIISDLNKKTTAFEESLQKNIDEQISKIPENEQDFVKKLLDGKELADQQVLLPSLLEKFSKPQSFGGEPNGNGNKTNEKARFAELNAKESLTINEEAEFNKLALSLSKQQS